MISFDRHPADGNRNGQRFIVLLHSLALDRSVWEGLIPHLQGDFEILAIDLPGHGKSSEFSGDTIEELADQVADLVQEQGMGPSIVIGLSLGGCVAQALAIRHPGLVEGLGLLDTTCWYGEDAPSAWEERAQRARRDGFDSLAGFQLARWFTADFLESNPDVGERLLDVFRGTDIDSYMAACRVMGKMDLRDLVSGISVPTSVIVGAEDPATTPAHSEELHRRIPGATLYVIPDCSHLSAVEKPGEIAELLRRDLFPRI